MEYTAASIRKYERKRQKIFFYFNGQFKIFSE